MEERKDLFKWIIRLFIKFPRGVYVGEAMLESGLDRETRYVIDEAKRNAINGNHPIPEFLPKPTMGDIVNVLVSKYLNGDLVEETDLEDDSQ